MTASPIRPKKVRLVGDARKERLAVVQSAKKFRELGKWYKKEAQNLGLTPAKVAQGVNTELQIFLLGKLSLKDQTRTQAVQLIIEDGRNMALMMNADVGLQYRKADFLARIDHTLKILPTVEKEVIRDMPYGRQIIAGLPRVRAQLAADKREIATRGAGIMRDIAMINTLRLRQILGEENFKRLSALNFGIMQEIAKKWY